MLQTLIGNKGGLIVEILVVIAIIAVAFASLSGLVVFSLGSSNLTGQNVQAVALAQETAEAVRNFRDGTSWNINGLGKLATSTDYYSKATSSPLKWQLIQGQETINNFTRKIVFSSVQRDINGNIIASGGVSDPETKSKYFCLLDRKRQISPSIY